MRSRQIGISINGIYRREGVASALVALIEGLDAVGAAHRVVLFGQKRDFAELTCIPKMRKCLTSPGDLKEAIRRSGIQVFHGPIFTIPMTRVCRTVVTIHDALLLENVDLLPGVQARQRQRLIAASATWADKIISVSNVAASSISKQLDFNEAKMEVVYNGIRSVYCQRSRNHCDINVLERFGIVPPYILYVGGVKPRKNLGILFKAFRQLLVTYAADLRLVVVNGRKGGAFAPELDRILHKHSDLYPTALLSRSSRSSNLVVTDSVTSDELVTLYRRARLFVYPSYAEGFGLPPVEAMGCGVPVMASHASAMPEILGSAAMLVRPHDRDDWVQGMWRLLHDERVREQMVIRGRRRADFFSSRNMALNTLAVYDKTLRS